MATIGLTTPKIYPADMSHTLAQQTYKKVKLFRNLVGIYDAIRNVKLGEPKQNEVFFNTLQLYIIGVLVCRFMVTVGLIT